MNKILIDKIETEKKETGTYILPEGGGGGGLVCEQISRTESKQRIAPENKNHITCMCAGDQRKTKNKKMVVKQTVCS